MNRKIALVAICILSLIVMSLGCDTPSEADIEQAVLKEIAGRSPVYGIEPNYKWVQEVKVIDIGRPFTISTIMG